MNILVIMMSSLNSINSATLRTIGLTKGLVQLGHQVTFLGMLGGSGITFHDYENDDDLNKINLIYLDGNIIKEKIWLDPSDITIRGRVINIIRKAYHKFSILGSTNSVAKNATSKLLDRKHYDVIISSSDPKTSHKAAHNIINSGLKYNKWIEYWGDPLASDITHRSIFPNWVLRKIERKLFSNADLIAYVSPVTLELQKYLFPNYSSKMIISTIPYLSPKYYSKESNSYQITYIGTYNSKVRNIMPFYEALLDLDEAYTATIMGDSDLSLDSTDYVTIYPRGDASTVEANSDLLVCILNKTGTQIPGKIYHSAATNLPILIITDGEHSESIVRYLSQFDRYNFCKNNKSDILKSINSIRNAAPQEKPCKEFSPVNVANMLLESCQKNLN